MTVAVSLTGKVTHIDQEEAVGLAQSSEQVACGDQHMLVLNKDNTLLAFGQVLHSKVTNDFNFQKMTELFLQEHKNLFKSEII